MSFFKNIFGGSEEQEQSPQGSSMNWHILNDISQLDDIVGESNAIPVLIFKHSTRCIISKTVLKNFEKEFNLEGEVEPFFLDLLEYRSISNEIANRFQVVHQSPQILLIKDGVCVYDASHDSISVDGVAGHL